MADMLRHFLARVPPAHAVRQQEEPEPGQQTAVRSEEILKVLPIPEPEEARTGQGRQAQTELGAHLQLLNLNLRSGKTTLPIGGRLAPPVFQRQLVTGLPGPVDSSLNTGMQIGFHIPTSRPVILWDCEELADELPRNHCHLLYRFLFQKLLHLLVHLLQGLVGCFQLSWCEVLYRSTSGPSTPLFYTW